MAKRRAGKDSVAIDAGMFAVKKRKAAPHEFVLEALASLSPRTRPMFGCLAAYVEEKIVVILRDKRDATSADDGVWLATTAEHHASLRRDFPEMRSIGVLGEKVTGWQVLPVDAPDFEESALRACELILAGDARIGKVPGTRRGSGLRRARRLKRGQRESRTGSQQRDAGAEQFAGRNERTTKPELNFNSAMPRRRPFRGEARL